MEIDPFRDPDLFSEQRVPLLKRIKKLFRKVDIYALPITLRYKSEKRFYTNFGALTSCFLVIAVMSFASSYVLTMLANENPTTQQKTAFISEKDKDLEKSGGRFLFAFRIIDSEAETDFDYNRYLKAEINTWVWQWNPEINDYTRDPINYPIEACEIEKLKNLNENLAIADPESLVRANFDRYMCPQGLNTNFISGGDFSSK